MKLLIVLFFTRKAINYSFSHENHRLLRRSLLILYPWKNHTPTVVQGRGRVDGTPPGSF